MKPLTRLATPPSYKARYDRLVAAKRSVSVRTRLLAIDSAIADRFAELEAAVDDGRLHEVVEDVALEINRADLLSCYENRTQLTKEILDAITASQRPRYLERCPYCGITLPRSFDHYLPKDAYPEFSVHPLNIAPCCAECNSSKGSRWLEDGSRLFLHYYSDTLPEEKYLFVAVTIRGAGDGYATKFRIAKPAGCSAENWRLVKAHYYELNLFERYREQANSEIANLFDNTVTFVEISNSTNVGAFIARMCDREELTFGVNHWRTVLKRELAESTVFKNRAVATALGLK